MKSLITLFAVSLISIVGISQGGNLEFSETKYIKLEGPLLNDGTVVSQTITVPEGQTWKIESATVNLRYTSGNAISYSYSEYVFLLLDHVLLWRFNDRSPYSFPVWLPAGTYDLSIWNDATWSANQYTAYSSLSILVFNIIP